jgi:2-dehydropantoate 2-reductase
MRRLRQEALACFEAAGIEAATAEEYREHVSSHFSQADVPGAQRGGSSTWQSLAKGSTRLETDYLNGEIVLLGKLYGVPTPYNTAVRALAQRLAAEGGRPGHFTFADIEAAAEGLATAATGD